MTVSHWLRDRERLQREAVSEISCDSCSNTIDVEAERPAEAGWTRELPGRESAWGAGGDVRWECPVCQRRRESNHSLEDWA